MKRTFNYTNRRRIPRKDIRIAVDEDSGTFTVELNWNEDEVPAGSKVLVEAYERAMYERHELGPVGEQLSQGPFALERVSSEQAMFRIKVVDASGRILSGADRIAPSGGEGADDDGAGKERRSLLHAQAVPLDGQVWRLSLDSQRFPVLEYEEQLAPKGFRSYLASDMSFRSIVMPEVARQILVFALIVDPQDDMDDGTWPTEWLQMGARWARKELPVEEDDLETKLEWIDLAVTGFARQLKAVEAVDAMLEAE